MKTIIRREHSEIWTKRTGKGKTSVILISGGPGVANYMEPVASMLEESFDVIQFDPGGCGRSLLHKDTYSLEECLLDIEFIREYYGIQNWWIIGHSWGADLGLAYVLEKPEVVVGFVSIAGTGIQNDRDWKEAYIKNKDRIGELTPQFRHPVNQLVHRSLLESWREFIKQPSLLRRISKIETPILFIGAEKDIRPSWPIQQLAALIETSESKLIIGAGHYIWLEKPEELKKRIIRYVEGN